MIEDLGIILQDRIRSALPQHYRSLVRAKINKLFNVEIKGILFEYFSNMGDIEAYKKVNNRSRKYLLKIRKNMSKEGFIIHEKLLDKKKLIVN